MLILDEPTDGLDPNQKHEVRELINAMAKDKIIVISTHILEEVDAVCTPRHHHRRRAHRRRRDAGRADPPFPLPQRGDAALREGRGCCKDAAAELRALRDVDHVEVDERRAR